MFFGGVMSRVSTTPTTRPPLSPAITERLNTASQGGQPEALEPWMEELYRRVSDRQTMGSVVQELRHSLSEAEKLIDQFFRNPADRNVLIDQTMVNETSARSEPRWRSCLPMPRPLSGMAAW